MKICYLCKSKALTRRLGQVRDASHIAILECDVCGLVFLDSNKHITSDFYANSGMHGHAQVSIERWLDDAWWDDLRRFNKIKALLPNKRLLDFGCGAGGFLWLAKDVASEAVGVELENRVREYWSGKIDIIPGVDDLDDKYDLITAFHVVEHLLDPRAILLKLSNILKPNGRLIIEVPNSNDALLSLYNCDAFQRFTYWSQHLFLFNSSTLELIARQAGFKVVVIQHYQRYPLSNHLHWLSHGKPGGHQCWSFIDTDELSAAYANSLAALGKTDTLIAHLEHIA